MTFPSAGKIYWLPLAALLQLICLNSSANPLNQPTGWNDEIKSLISQIDFASIKEDHSELLLFFKQFPKGGNLHHHYSGGIYAGDMINRAIDNKLCINPQNLSLNNCTQNATTIAEMAESTKGQVIIKNAWSLAEDSLPLNQQIAKFYGLFPALGPLFTRIDPKLLAITRHRVANHQVSYLETMVDLSTTSNLENILPKGVIPDPGNPNSLAQFYAKLTNQNSYKALLSISDAMVNNVMAQSDDILQCHTNTPDSGCNVRVGFIGMGHRTADNPLFFAQMILSFDLTRQQLASKANHVVGTNIVGLESSLEASANYLGQMKMIAFLKEMAAYSSVQDRISLHAGELALSSSPPELLATGMQETINIVRPARVGHGVSIRDQSRFDQDLDSVVDASLELANVMANANIVVEVPLTSNRILLDVYGKKHPLAFYHEQGVPVVLATDDPGLLRTDMTQEFVIAAETFDQLTLADFVEFTRNTLEFSFQAGESLWQQEGSKRYQTPNSNCTDLDSASCKALGKSNIKAGLQRQHELNLLDFLKNQVITRPDRTL